MSPARIALLQHADHEGPGAIATTAAARGAKVDVHRSHAGDPPPGSRRPAGGEIYPNQAFRCGGAWGLQFHVEVDEALLDDRRPHLPEDALPSAGQSEAIGAAAGVPA